VTLDAIAARYGKLPTEILDLSIEDFSLNSLVLSTALKYEASARKGHTMRLSRGGDPREEVVGQLEDMFAKVNSRPKNSAKRRR
jgi:hypothetical protein